MIMKKVIYLTAFFVTFGLYLPSIGQTKAINGRIVDEHLTPMSGAYMQTVDSSYTSKADNKGYYSITIPDSVRQIKVWFIGMESEIINLSDFCEFNIILLDDIIAEFETQQEHKMRYQKRKRELPKKRIEAIKRGIIEENKTCS